MPQQITVSTLSSARRESSRSSLLRLTWRRLARAARGRALCGRFASALVGAVAAGFWLALACAPASAGIADTPLPVFSDGKSSVLVYAMTGAIRQQGMQTEFLCTSLASVPVDIGVELFDEAGVRLNDVGADQGAVLNVAPGQTVTIATSPTQAFSETTYLSPFFPPRTFVAQGSARVVASSPDVRCNAMILDDLVTPPTALGNLGAPARPTPGALPPSAPLPTFGDGKPATHAILYPGIAKNGPVETLFSCTSLASVPIDIGVEIFDSNGVLQNDVGDNTATDGAILAVLPGQTVTIATGGTWAFGEDEWISLGTVAQGLARVVTNSPEVICSAALVDDSTTPPASITGLAARLPGAATPTLPNPLPAFYDGKPSVHVMTIPGAMKRGQLQTLVMCSSVASGPVDIGVELYDVDGNLVNLVSSNVGAVLDVPPGSTVTFATSATAAMSETVVIPTQNKQQGVARVVASSDQVVCNALVVDDTAVPPVTTSALGDGQMPQPGARPASVGLPVFSDGKPAAYSLDFPGLVKRLDVETDILCTSLATTNVDIGVQVLKPDGTLANDVAGGNGAVLNVTPGATVAIGTTGTAALFEKTVIVLSGVAQGMGRVVSTSDQILCSGLVLDAGLAPPTSMARLLSEADMKGVCGNGVVEPGEQCDGAADQACPGQCGSGCLCPPVCGDGFVQTGEQCDDGNQTSGDCCSATCQFEPAGSPCPDDGNVCNGPETCNGVGWCVSGPGVSCDDGNLCTVDSCVPSTGQCLNEAAPATGCLLAGAGQLQIKDHPTKPADQIKWKWQRGDAFNHGAIGNPAVDTGYTLCIYDYSAGVPALATSLTLPPSGLWVERAPKGWKYKDKTGAHDGIQGLQFRPGSAGKTKVQLKAKGVVPVPVPFSAIEMFDQDPMVTVQLFASNRPVCWSASFTAAQKNTASQFKAKFR